MNQKALFTLLLSILILQTSLSFTMSKTKLVALATGLGASYAGWNEYKQWTGPQPSPAVQKWIKKTLTSQGVSDAQLNAIKIGHNEMGFFSMKSQINTPIVHAHLRIAQLQNILRSVDQQRKKIMQGDLYDPALEARNAAPYNFLAKWSVSLAHEFAHLYHKDYKKGHYYDLKKELKSLPLEVTQYIPKSHQIIHQIYWYNSRKLIDSLSELSPNIAKLVNEIYQVAEFKRHTERILENQRENNSTNYAKPISDTFEFPQELKKSKDIERNADRKAIEVYLSDPEKLWAAAFLLSTST